MRADQNHDRAVWYFFQNRTGWSGKVIPGKNKCWNPERWNIVGTDRIEKAAETLRNTRITCGDYHLLLEEPGENVWAFLDPPFLSDTFRSKGQRFYEFSFEIEDHERLAEIVRSCKHKVLISYDDSPFIRSLYKGFNIHEASWMYTVGANRRMGRELLIANYEQGETAADAKEMAA